MNKVYDVNVMSDSRVNKVVKIKGTQYDRKRKITDEQIDTAKKLRAAGVNYREIAKEIGFSARVISYHLNPEFRETIIRNMTGKATRQPADAVRDRAAYKRELVNSGKVTVTV